MSIEPEDTPEGEEKPRPRGFPSYINPLDPDSDFYWRDYEPVKYDPFTAYLMHKFIASITGEEPPEPPPGSEERLKCMGKWFGNSAKD